MATKVRIACLGDSIVLLLSSGLIRIVEIEPEFLKEEIKHQIKLGGKVPLKIFKKSIENISEIPFSIKIKDLNLTVYDSKYYKKYLRFINKELKEERMKKKRKKEKRKKKKLK